MLHVLARFQRIHAQEILRIPGNVVTRHRGIDPFAVRDGKEEIRRRSQRCHKHMRWIELKVGADIDFGSFGYCQYVIRWADTSEHSHEYLADLHSHADCE